MRRPRRLLLCLTLALLFCAACAEPAQGKDPPRARGVTSHRITGPPRTTQARLWHHRAVERRKPCVRLRWCLGFRKASAIPRLPTATSSQTAWDRCAKRCKRLAGEFTRQRHSLTRQLMHPQIRNLGDWLPLCRWYWRGSGTASCAACGASLGSPVAIAMHILHHESGGHIDPVYGAWGDLPSTAAQWGIDVHSPASSAEGNYRLYRACGVRPWPYLR